MLRRHSDSAGALRGLLRPKSCSRNVSAASVLRADRRIFRREGFLSWLKGIFNKTADTSNEDGRSHEVAVASVGCALPPGRLETAVLEAADPSSFDVVNQKPAADFDGVASTTKFGSAVERGGATQQLAIYAEPARPSSRDDDRTEEEKTTTGGRETSERGRDSSRLDLQRGEIHRAERIGAIEFAARDDALAAHYRCYTRHCYRLPPARTSLLLLAAYGPNGNISVPTRAIAAFAARNSKPPIREPNMPEKRERKDEKEKRDKKEKKEPVIRAERESADSSESRAAMVAGDNPTGDPDAPFRYEWGVKLAEEEPPADNDNLAEKGRRYVTKRLWGVNLTQPDVEDAAAPPTSGGPGRRGAYEPRNASRLFENDDTAAAGETRGQVSSRRASDELNSATQDRLSAWLNRDSASRVDSVTAQRETTVDASSPTSSQALRKIMTAESKETTALDDDALEGAVSDAEISAWRSLSMKSKPAMQAILLAMQSEKMERVSIRPEAPQPKLDVRVVRSTDDLAEDDKRNEQSVGYKLSSIGLKHVGSTETPSLDNYSSSKKLHTASAQVHHAPRDDSGDVVRRSAGSVSSTSGTARTKNPVLKAAELSTNPEDSMEEETSDDHRQSDGQQTTDAQDLFEEKPNSSESDSFNEQTPSEFQTDSSSGQKPPIDLAETPSDAIADERRMEISTRQSADRASIFAQEDESRGDRERRNFEDAHVSYDRIDSPGDEDQDASYADVEIIDPTRSTESAEEAVESVFATSSVLEANAEDPSDDDDAFGRQYITDGDYVRIRGDPYPYDKEHLDKWRMPVSRSLLYKPIKRQSLFPGLSSDRSSPRDANDAFDADEQSYDSHAVRAVMETSGSGDGASGAKNVRSSRDQRVAAPDCDAADELGLRGWTEAFSRLGRAGKTSEAERGRDNASLRAYRQ